MTTASGTHPTTPQPSATTDAPLIVARGVSKVYHLYKRPMDRLKAQLTGRSFGREFWALRDVDLVLNRGQTLGIIGRNGSGKSTLLQILAGILQPSQGTLQVNGRVAALLELGSGFNPEYPGRDNVYLNGAILGVGRDQMRERFDDIAAFADIGTFIDQPVKTYSSGMFVRLAFAVATHVDADILLVDEALAVGDVFFRQKCYLRLEELRRRGVSIILVSHSMMEVEQFCRECMLLDKGVCTYSGSGKDAVRRYFLLQQEERPASSAVQEPGRVSSPADSTGEIGVSDTFENPTEFFWPPPESMLNLDRVEQVSNGWARCAGVALCDISGRPSQVFPQGQTASFFYEFLILRDIEVPVGGVLITNDRGVIVHGKHTIQIGTAVPTRVPAGSRLRFRQDIVLDLECLEYVFEVGLVTLGRVDYERRVSMTPEELEAAYIRVCHLPRVGSFAMTFPITDGPRQISHYGVANLRAQCVASVVPPSSAQGASAPAEVAAIAPRASAPPTPPTVFHITHWKAGSQWIYRILRATAPSRIVAPEVEEAQFLHRAIQLGGIYPTVYVTSQQFQSVRPPADSRRFVIVRDLRDTLVSAYFSFKISHGNVGPAFMDLRRRLETLDFHAGMMYLMEEWLPRCARIQLSWLEAGEELIFYHDLLENDLPILRRILLDKCQLPLGPDELERIVMANRFEAVAGRPRGQEDVNAHERKGISGDWKNHLDGRLKQAFKDRFGGVLIAMGLEKNFDW